MTTVLGCYMKRAIWIFKGYILKCILDSNSGFFCLQKVELSRLDDLENDLRSDTEGKDKMGNKNAQQV